MKIKLFLMGFLIASPLFALEVTKPELAQTKAAGQTVVVSPSQAVPASADQTVAPQKKESETPVVVSEASAPPSWFASFLDTASNAPLVGPIFSTILKYVGAIATVATLLVTFLLGLIRVLVPLFNLTNLVKLSEALTVFSNSKAMYWLKTISVYNAKKKENGTTDKVS